jgi:peptidoglycan/LPS O-acetylase OafA/YrhL
MQSQKLASIQALRGIAAFMVCFFHLAGHSDGNRTLLQSEDPLKHLSSFGPTGVFVFFVISGFVIPLSMDRSKFDLSKAAIFFKKRLWRLHPPYLVTLAITIAIGVYNNSTGMTHLDLSAMNIVSHFFYVTHIFNLEWLNPIFWTLAIEIQYYIILVVLFSWINSDQIWKRATVIALLLSSTWLLPDDRFITYYISPFIVGFSCYYFLVKKFSFLECAVYAIAASFVILQFVGLHWLIASLAAAAFILYITSVHRSLSFLGNISYSLYLTHPMIGGLIIFVLMPFSNGIITDYIILFSGLAASIAFSWLFYRLVEVPSMRKAQNVS